MFSERQDGCAARFSIHIAAAATWAARYFGKNWSTLSPVAHVMNSVPWKGVDYRFAGEVLRRRSNAFDAAGDYHCRLLKIISALLLLLSMLFVSFGAIAEEIRYCASRNYDHLGVAVSNFHTNSWESNAEAHQIFPQYRTYFEMSVSSFEIDMNSAYVLHDNLSYIRRNGRKIPVISLVVCRSGMPGENLCRNANYWFSDWNIGPEQIHEIVRDIVLIPNPATVGTCVNRLKWPQLTED